MSDLQMRVFVENEGFYETLDRKLGAGDDAQPYVGRRVVSVADGMGGSGAQRVKSFIPAMADREKSFDTVMAGCLSPETEEDYREQYDENFAQLYALGDADYRKSGGRHSSYFGSRLASVLIRAALEVEFPAGKGDETLAALSQMDDDAREKWLDDLEKRLVDWVQPRLRAAVKNGRIDAGTSEVFKESAMMGTTYTGFVFSEEDDCVHTICVQAGDSLPWALLVVDDGENGEKRLVLNQLMRAQEESSGGITNFIGVNNAFYLRCAYFRLEKPCAIMAASDGAFDFFPTTMHFEHFLMYSLMQADSIERCAEIMKEYYAQAYTNDDSSTVAFKAFGFESYEALAELANRRQIELSDPQCFGMDDEALYSQDKSPEYYLRQANLSMIDKVGQFRDRLWDTSASLRQDALAMAMERNKTRMQQIEEEGTARLEKLKSERHSLRKALTDEVRGVWLSLREELGVRGANEMGRGFFGMGESLDEQRKSATRDKKDLYAIAKRILAQIEKIATETERVCEDCEKTGQMSHAVFYDYNALYCDTFDAADKLMNEMASIGDSLRRKEEKISRSEERILREEEDYIDEYAKQLEEDPEQILKLKKLSDAEKQNVCQCALAVREASQSLSEGRKAADAEKLAFARRVYEANLPRLISKCLSEHKDEIDEALYREMQDAVAPEKAAIAEARENQRRRDQYIGRYQSQTQAVISERR